ncbi:DUF4188 domain-containing protein [Tengunoibacter tsumagoiensis]|uniref:Transcriptional regulator n=1 Tax=Tengunoibacter tsumagoiensis TaxID=2014871 RepID=A0A402A4K8_9CHLR|nr:DUF4188 domain-containing protein [Tengunoibacter tsumagoiensis]GCE14042.1 transcriptional regulator [Tengunoibacter tsumagoiensis]
MKEIASGRYTAHIEGPFVVFILGMRINRFWAFRKWFAVVKAMAPMMKELYTHPETGFLGGRSSLTPWREITVIQYWRSFEALEHFARSKDSSHLPAWQQFNKSISPDGCVGIWHESFLVADQQYEAIYHNMPIHGLAAATEHVPLRRKGETARQRLKQDVVPSTSGRW